MRVKTKVLMCVLGAFLALLPCTAMAQTLRVLAAANLQKVMSDAVVPAFERATGTNVTPTFGSTKLLATQLTNGAPCDVFVSADTDTLTKLAAHYLVEKNTVRPYAVGSLVLWARKDALLHPQSITELTDPRYRKIAIANPALAPYGLAAQQAFAATGLTASVATRLVLAENIGQAFQYAQSGNADVCLTALSLVVGDKSGTYVIVPERLHAPLTQSVAVSTRSTQPRLAAQFEDFLTSKECAPLWTKYGYSLPAKESK